MLKKLFIFLLPFLMSGCLFGEVGSGYITKTCKKEVFSDGVIVNMNQIVRQKDNEVLSITQKVEIIDMGDTNSYNLIKNTYLSEINNISSLSEFTTVENVGERKVVLSYEFDFSKIDDNIKRHYDFEPLFHNQIKKYEKEGYICN